MKTAREQLFEEITALLTKTPAEAAAEMKKLMARYRVQTKPGVEIAGAATARDALGDRLLLLLQGADDEATRQKIGTTIDEFRMQLKQAGGPSEKSSSSSSSSPQPRPSVPKPPRPSPLSPSPSSSSSTSADRVPPERPSRDVSRSSAGGFGGLGAPSSKKAPPPLPMPSRSTPRPASVTLGVGEAPARLSKSAEPVAGGPRARKKARAECPKCHSMGVVLARSYSGDEYYSCIYCGWQAYKPADDDDPNASLALRLLGQTAGTE